MTFLAVTAVLLIIFNLVMWVVFAFKFKRIFSTDDVISEVKENIDELKKSLYKSCGTYIDVIDDRIKQLKSVTADAERKIEMYRSTLSGAASVSFQQQVDSALNAGKSLPKSEKKSRSRSNSTISGRYERNLRQQDLFLSSKAIEELGRQVLEPEAEKAEPQVQKIVHVPIVQPEFYVAEKGITERKSFAQQVSELHRKGYTEEEIASELKRSIQEVKFSLEIS